MTLSCSFPARGWLAALVIASLSVVAGCASEENAAPPVSATASEAASAEAPADRVTVLPQTDPAELALQASRTFFSTAPVVVVAQAGDEQAQATAAAAAEAVTGPVLIVGGSVSNDAIVTELRRLDAVAVVEVLPEVVLDPSEQSELALTLPPIDGVSVVPLDAAARDDSGQIAARELDALREQLPQTSAPRTLHEVLALVEGTPEQVAAVATAEAAGAWSVVVPGGDPRASAATVESIAEAQPLAIVGIGPSFGTPQELEWKVDVAQAGAELPGGGQLVFPGKHIIATPAEAVTGRQQTPRPSSDTSDLIADAQEAAAAYAEGVDSEAVVVPALEIAVTTVSASAGDDGDYSESIPAQSVRPLIDAASAAGVYVVLRFEPGRATFRDQITEYADLLSQPGVGVALDVSARRGESAKQDATVTAAELNDALAALAEMVRDEALPQLLVVVQQGDPEAILDRETLAVGSGELAVVLDVTANARVSTQPAQWTKNLTGAPVGTHGGWTTVAADPATEAASVAKLTPVPEYVAGSH